MCRPVLNLTGRPVEPAMPSRHSIEDAGLLMHVVPGSGKSCRPPYTETRLMRDSWLAATDQLRCYTDISDNRVYRKQPMPIQARHINHASAHSDYGQFLPSLSPELTSCSSTPETSRPAISPAFAVSTNFANQRVPGEFSGLGPHCLPAFGIARLADQRTGASQLPSLSFRAIVLLSDSLHTPVAPRTLAVSSCDA